MTLLNSDLKNIIVDFLEDKVSTRWFISEFDNLVSGSSYSCLAPQNSVLLEQLHEYAALCVFNKVIKGSNQNLFILPEELRLKTQEFYKLVIS